MSSKLKHFSRKLVRVSKAAVVLLLWSWKVYCQELQNEPFDSTASFVREITVHGKRMMGYIKRDRFYLANSNGKIVLKSGEGCSSWKFVDFNRDGDKDILVEYFSNTPGEADLYLYLQSTNKFVPVKDFDDFPAAEPIKGTCLYYSYHHSGCADDNWDSDLFCLRDFKAIRLGNISGVGCADKQEKKRIYVSKIGGDKSIPVRGYPISVIRKYRDNKWGFIKEYWTTNYQLFQDKIALTSKC